MIKQFWATLDRWRALGDRVVGINRRNVELIYPNNPRRHYPVADDKLLAKKILGDHGVPVPETLAVAPGLFAVPTLIERIRGEAHVVLKPANGSGGVGILVLGELLEPGRWRKAGGAAIDESQVAQHAADVVFGAFSGQLEDQLFVERRIVPHPLFAGLWADGLCDVRVIALMGEPVMAMVRVPTARSGGRANLHQGGLGLAIDLHTGTTTRAVSLGQSIATHPESGAPLLGLAIPAWPTILEVVRRTAKAVPLGYLGVDVVVDHQRGPMVLEINVRPGLEIQNVNGLGLTPGLERARAALAARPAEEGAR